jgi:hypothetical protein
MIAAFVLRIGCAIFAVDRDSSTADRDGSLDDSLERTLHGALSDLRRRRAGGAVGRLRSAFSGWRRGALGHLRRRRTFRWRRCGALGDLRRRRTCRGRRCGALGDLGWGWWALSDLGWRRWALGDLGRRWWALGHLCWRSWALGYLRRGRAFRDWRCDLRADVGLRTNVGDADDRESGEEVASEELAGDAVVEKVERKGQE